MSDTLFQSCTNLAVQRFICSTWHINSNLSCYVLSHLVLLYHTHQRFLCMYVCIDDTLWHNPQEDHYSHCHLNWSVHTLPFEIYYLILFSVIAEDYCYAETCWIINKHFINCILLILLSHYTAEQGRNVFKLSTPCISL